MTPPRRVVPLDNEGMVIFEVDATGRVVMRLVRAVDGAAPMPVGGFVVTTSAVQMCEVGQAALDASRDAGQLTAKNRARASARKAT